MPVKWIQHEGRRILYSDYRGLKSDAELISNLRQEDKFIKESPIKILSLNDYRDTLVSKTFMNEISKLGKENKEKTLRAAVLGISGVKKILLSSYARITGEPLRIFDNEKDALEYLVK